MTSSRGGIATDDPIQPVYPFQAVGAPIDLYRGNISVDGAESRSGRVFVDMAGDLEVRWLLTGSAPDFEPGTAVELGIMRPDIGWTTVPAQNYSSSGSGVIGDATLGAADASCERVIVHFANLPSIFPFGSGRMVLSGAGWNLDLEGRADHPEILRELKQSLFFAVTHAASLRRADGASFKASEAAEAIEAFQLALSFALGRWIAPVAPVGFDGSGKRVWEQWASWRCSPASGYLPWWSTGDGGDLQDFVRLFGETWSSSEYDREVIRHVARHLIAAHHRGTTIEAKIMLVHAALEYLSWVTYVVPGKRTATQHGKDKNRTPAATWHLKELLRPAKIKVRIPTSLPGLRKFARAEGLPSGPAAVSRLRNKLIHPKDAGEPYRIEGLVTEAWQLASEYGELLLLHRVGYQGKYLPRSDIAMPRSVSVPWAA